jgi:hypothetical protein
MHMHTNCTAAIYLPRWPTQPETVDAFSHVGPQTAHPPSYPSVSRCQWLAVGGAQRLLAAAAGGHKGVAGVVHLAASRAQQVQQESRQGAACVCSAIAWRFVRDMT